MPLKSCKAAAACSITVAGKIEGPELKLCFFMVAKKSAAI